MSSHNGTRRQSTPLLVGRRAGGQVDAHALSSPLSKKLVLRTLERTKWQGPAFETYRTKVLLERFEERAPASAVDFDLFCGELGQGSIA